MNGEAGPPGLVMSGYYRGLTRRAARASKTLAGIVAVAGIVAGVITARGVLLEHRWSRGYELVQRGDTRERVVAIMGDAARSYPCGPERRWGETLLKESAQERCADARAYAPFPFLEAWTFEFDSTGRVVSKYHWELD